MFIHYLGLRLANDCKMVVYADTKNISLILYNVSLIHFIFLGQSYCLDGNLGPLLTSKMEFFAIIVNSFKP